MKIIEKIILIVSIIFLSVVLLQTIIARAEPFLVYNPNIQIVGYEIDINGTVSAVEPAQTPAGTFKLVYDLAGLPPGPHQVKARAEFELWGWVPWSESFEFIKPQPMTGPTITTNPQ